MSKLQAPSERRAIARGHAVNHHRGPIAQRADVKEDRPVSIRTIPLNHSPGHDKFRELTGRDQRVLSEIAQNPRLELSGALPHRSIQSKR